MTEAADITANLRAAGRLHTRIDSLGTGRRQPINPSMLGALLSAQTTAHTALDELVRLASAAVQRGTPNTVDSEAVQQGRAALDQALAKIDAVLYDVVAAAEA